MEIIVDRKYKKDTYTIGKMYIDGVYFCDTVEDKDRGLKKSTPLEEIKSKKVYAETAIPTGSYRVTLNVVSGTFGKKDFYIKNANGGRVPRLLNVPGFDGILIHSGSNASHSAGCILVGLNKVKGGVTNSQETFIKLYKKLQSAKDPITILIK